MNILSSLVLFGRGLSEVICGAVALCLFGGLFMMLGIDLLSGLVISFGVVVQVSLLLIDMRP